MTTPNTISQITRKICGGDFLDEFLPEAKGSIKRIGERPQARKVNDHRTAAMDAYTSRTRK